MRLTVDGSEEGHGEVDPKSQNEQIEDVVVANTDAIVDPLAVVVETFNTAIAGVAVPGV